MLGLDDPLIWGGYVLCLLSTVLCVVYGAITWNSTGEAPPEPEDTAGDQEDQKIDEAL